MLILKGLQAPKRIAQVDFLESNPKMRERLLQRADRLQANGRWNDGAAAPLGNTFRIRSREENDCLGFRGQRPYRSRDLGNRVLDSLHPSNAVCREGRAVRIEHA